MMSFKSLALLLVVISSVGATSLAPLPPMGWMSWERFRCETDCVTYPDACIDENLYRNMTIRLAEDGYLAAGYNMVNVDDCWMAMERDANGLQVGDPDRFPSGMGALGDFMHGLASTPMRALKHVRDILDLKVTKLSMLQTMPHGE